MPEGWTRRAVFQALRARSQITSSSRWSPEWSEIQAQKYGISPDEHARLLIAQNGVCAVCRRPEAATNQYGVLRLAVDHDHVTDKVRGLLCSNCNQGIGRFKDDPALLRAAADYLEKAK